MSGPELTASQEDYLEAIYHVTREHGAARSRDLVQRLGVNSSSVTQALHGLGERGMIHHRPYGDITLTERGEALALDVIRRHEALRTFFVEILGVAPGPAEEAACRMEHAMPREIVDRLLDYIRTVSTRPESTP